MKAKTYKAATAPRFSIIFSPLSPRPRIASTAIPSLTNNDCRLGWFQPGGSATVTTEVPVCNRRLADFGLFCYPNHRAQAAQNIIQGVKIVSRVFATAPSDQPVKAKTRSTHHQKR
jgi:hypothetical protein